MDLPGCPDEPTLWMRHERPSGFGLYSASGWKRLVCRRRNAHAGSAPAVTSCPASRICLSVTVGGAGMTRRRIARA